ncbi:C-type lectin domain family 2 member D-like [Mauremys reevesii]|uniref:C-type lectin domain family 2 member D-like n=1 Tax=Mauremys reevesii TaxID=260615 RepID=UPI00193F23F6|nr:C-type lectin domain family 2 member D-like [Mauremys reevesii]
MGPEAGEADSQTPLNPRVNGDGHPETGWWPEPRCNCKRRTVALTIVFLVLIIAVIVLAVLLYQRSSAALGPWCPDGWVGYRGKCYYFSEAEENWNNSQSNCSSLGASLAVIDTLQDLAFMQRYKGKHQHWIGLRRDPGQPWKWANGTEFNNLFPITGDGDCAYLADENMVSSLRCTSERYWICSKPDAFTKQRRLQCKETDKSIISPGKA